MSDNLKIWQTFADIDPQFTKPITGKAYKGTSPNPQYVIMCLTNLFGPVGQGFGWEVLSDGFERLGDEVLHWCRIRFWHTSRENWFEAYGQTKAVLKTSNGPRVDEDAPKKSLTDAIVKAASQLGIAANIFLGRWDDQKYVATVNEGFRDKEEPHTTDQIPDAGRREVAQQKDRVSYAEMKRGLAAIEQDLLDCKTTTAVKKCAEGWKHIFERDGWTRDYVDVARDKFAARIQEIKSTEAEDVFPGDTKLTGEGGQHQNTIYNPIMAG